jgi:hypothetical protein
VDPLQRDFAAEMCQIERWAVSITAQSEERGYALPGNVATIGWIPEKS